MRLQPLAVAGIAMSVYVMLALPILARQNWDVSFFVVAGDYFVNSHRLAAPIVVRPNSTGYDGQFYYRMAVAPFSFAHERTGIWFDVPLYRSQRILYPLLAWIVAAGQPGGAAIALFALNVVGIGAVALLALSLVRRLGLADSTAWAIAAWPGLLVTLTHDTAEIVALAFLLGALLCRFEARWGWYAVLGAAATLTRETTALAFAGLLAWDALQLRRGGPWRRVLLGILLLLPVLAWHEALPFLWRPAGAEGVSARVLGWPLIGLARGLRDRVGDLLQASPGHDRRALAAANLLATVLMFAFAVRAAIAAWRAKAGPWAAIIAAWVPLALLLAFLRSGDDSPIATPLEFGRSFTEFWALGCLVIAAGSPTRRAPILLASVLSASVVVFVRMSFGLTPL